MNTNRLSLLTLMAAVLLAAPALAGNKAQCASNVEQYMKGREKFCEERFKKEPLQVGKCKEMLAGEKPKMLKQCEKNGEIKYEKEK